MRCSVHLLGIASLVIAASLTASAQGPVVSGQTAAPATSQAYGAAGAGQVITVTPSAGVSPSAAPGVTTQSPFQGSVPTGKPTGTVLPITVKEALDRALKYNLGVIESDQNTRAARAQRLRNLSALLPNLYGQTYAELQQVNLRALGLRQGVIGVRIPSIVGPFAVEDVRGYLTQNIFNWNYIQNLRSALQSETAAKLSYKSDRDTVVLVTATAYLQVIADIANVESNQAQVRTNQTIYDRNVDQFEQGTVASIDVLRSKVQLQTQQQQLIAVQNQLSIDKLTLARIIGLPNGQEFELTDKVPYSELTGITLEQALAQAYVTRPDYKAAKAQVRAAELAYQAAAAENYPSLGFSGNYGDIGSPNLGMSHGTFAVTGTLTIPLFLGTQVRADKLQADTVLRNRKAQLEDLGGKIDDQVRTAFFNLQSSSDLVAVGKSNIDLANQTLVQSQDRFEAGVTNNVEVVQSQQAVAAAQQSYIASVYSYNAAKIALAQAIGVAEQSGLAYLGVK